MVMDLWYADDLGVVSTIRGGRRKFLEVRSRLCVGGETHVSGDHRMPCGKTLMRLSQAGVVEVVYGRLT
jgi:hypothetical protein